MMQHLIHNTIQYNLAYPKGMDPAEKYPLVIYVHGAGGRGHDPANIGFSYMIADYLAKQDIPAITAAPLCEFDNWYMCFTELVEFIRFAATMEHVDPDRVYLMGASMGGYATWALLMCVPELIAAAAPICGGGMAWNAVRMKDVPIWAFHGVDDSVVAVTESISMAKALYDCGGKIKLSLLPETNHNAWEPALKEHKLIEWMLMHRLSDRG